MLQFARIIAHRGGRPENTLAAFRRVAGRYAVETDVHLTADGVVVCHHDPNVGSKIIEESTFEELQLPTLVEALAFGGRWMVELKGASDALIDATLQAIPTGADAFLGSLSPDTVGKIRARLPRERVIGIAETEDDLKRHLSHDPAFLALYYPLATDERVALLQQRHGVMAWTANETDEMRRLGRLGVGVITDYPERFPQSG